MNDRVLVLGAGMTGLAAGMASGLPVLEAAGEPGGICCSYYLAPGSRRPLAAPPADDEAYRFENGGGHWLFGGDPSVLRFVRSLVPVGRYARRAAVFFPESGCYVPYPLQNHLRALGREIALTALDEMTRPAGPIDTMANWLRATFGPTLNDIFFAPFHERYTAGLYTRIAPQDAYKSPQVLALALRGAFDDTPAVGYNTVFAYPRRGLDLLARRMAERCDVAFRRRIVQLDVERRVLLFADGAEKPYRTLLSTLPLNRLMEMAGLTVAARPDPFTSVLVVNLGATKGRVCPEEHWIYVPRSVSGFHRVGFYSNVDPGFLPAAARPTRDRVSIYVERSFPGGQRPADGEIEVYCEQIVDELRDWGFVERVEVVHPTWIDVAYTWSWPGSRWRDEALQLLQEKDIYQIGRYGRWMFQGIADSIRDGFVAGSSFRRF